MPTAQERPGADAAARQAAASRHLREADAALDRAVAEFTHAITLDPTPTQAALDLMWTLQRRRGQHLEYFSESFQDRFLNETVFENRRSGVFVDIGAYDGVTGSNTLFFEKFLGWTGLCIEPDPDRFATLLSMRTAACLQTCVAGCDGEAAFLHVREGFTQMSGLLASMPQDVSDFLTTDSAVATITLPTMRLNQVLEEYGLTRIDYLSIDIEGAEYEVLSTLDFDRCHITAISVERNRNEAALHDLLRRTGFCRVRQLGGDDIYVQASLASHLKDELLAQAIAAYEQGDMPRAEAIYRDILLTDTSNPGIHYNFALALRAQAKHAEANAALTAALTLKPDFPPALTLLSS